MTFSLPPGIKGLILIYDGLSSCRLSYIQFKEVLTLLGPGAGGSWQDMRAEGRELDKQN